LNSLGLVVKRGQGRTEEGRMALFTASENRRVGEESSRMAPFTSTSNTPFSSKDRHERQWLENNTNIDIVNDEGDTYKDYYAKFEEDSQFRNFVENLLHSSSSKSLKICKKEKLDKLHKISDTKDNVTSGNTETVLESSQANKTGLNKGTDHKIKQAPKISHTKDTLHKNSETSIAPQCNDDISFGRGQYRDLVRDRLGERRGLHMETRSGGRGNEAGDCSDNYGNFSSHKNAGEKKTIKLGDTKSCSYSLPREKASVVLREKHLSPRLEREECTKSGVFTMPRVSCYHRSTRI